MPTMIIPDIDSRSICGNGMPPTVHALSSMCYCRLAVMEKTTCPAVGPKLINSKVPFRQLAAIVGTQVPSKRVTAPRTWRSARCSLKPGGPLANE